MEKYCGKCGSRLDEDIGLCPRCDKKKLAKRKRTASRITPVYIAAVLLLAAALLVCIPKLFPSDHSDVTQQPKCNHQWEPATCEQAKVCTRCGYIAGVPLQHVQGEWTEDLDLIACKLTRSVHCRNCGIRLESEEAVLDSFVKDNTYIFTPRQFLERLTHIVQLKFGTASYQVVPADFGILVNFSYGNSQTALFLFLHSDMTAVSEEELDQKDVYCVSAYFPLDETEDDGSCMQEFLKACDPNLDNDHANTVTALCLASLQNALNEGYSYSTFQYDALLYDVVYASGALLGFSSDTALGLSVYPAAAKSAEANRPVLKSDYEISTDQETLGEAIPAYNVFGSTISKECIDSIKFLSSLTEAPEDAWDVSEAGDRSVLAWITPTSEDRYDLFIAGEGGVWSLRTVLTCLQNIAGWNRWILTMRSLWKTAKQCRECSTMTNTSQNWISAAGIHQMSKIWVRCSYSAVS